MAFLQDHGARSSDVDTPSDAEAGQEAATPASPVHCLNCRAEVLGRFCGACGQRHSSRLPKIRDVTRDFFRSFLDLETGLLATLRDLFLYPGRMSAEYIAGRRIPYISPARLYLSASLVFSLALAISPNFMVTVRDGASDSAARALWMRGWIWSVLALVPVFAILLQVAFRNPPRTFTEHLLVAIHYHAFAFLLGSVTLVLIDRLADTGPVIVAAFAGSGLLFTWHLIQTLRTVYGCSFRAALAKSLAILVGYTTIQLVCMLGIAFGLTAWA